MIATPIVIPFNLTQAETLVLLKQSRAKKDDRRRAEEDDFSWVLVDVGGEEW